MKHDKLIEPGHVKQNNTNDDEEIIKNNSELPPEDKAVERNMTGKNNETAKQDQNESGTSV